MLSDDFISERIYNYLKNFLHMLFDWTIEKKICESADSNKPFFFNAFKKLFECFKIKITSYNLFRMKITSLIYAILFNILNFKDNLEIVFV